ncbi:MAG: peptidase [Frankiales bacterium]|nr:peptidase [Frankiales bacterium]
MTKTLERRFWTQPVEIRAGADGTADAIGGYAAVFNKLSQNLGGFVEEIDPGAFTRDLEGTDVVCLFNHDENLVVGRTGVNLVLQVDDTGLDYRCVPYLDDPTAVSLVSKVRNGLVTQSSFGFYCDEDDWGWTEQGFPLRRVLRARLADVSPVTRPAYLDATTGLRSLSEARGLDLAAVVAAAGTNTLGELLGEQRSEAPPATPDVPARRRLGLTAL